MCFSSTSNITMTAKMAKPDLVTLPTVDEYQPWVTEGKTPQSKQAVWTAGRLNDLKMGRHSSIKYMSTTCVG